MLKRRVIKSTILGLLAGVLASSFFVSAAAAQSDAPAGKSAVRASNRYHTNNFSKRARLYYEMVWGIDSLSVKMVESGQIIRFAYRVLNPEKAAALNDKKSEPYLLDPQAGVKLVVPTMEKIGRLRQATTPETGKSYWTAFSNKGVLVKRGARVNVEIGLFRAEGLEVQ
jgi:hypothetical protein